MKNNSDLFRNPFLNIDSKTFLTCYENDNEIYVPKHEFAIISETKKGKRSIIFTENDSMHYQDEMEKIAQKCGWNEVYLWDMGSMVVKSQEDDFGVEVIIEEADDCHTPHLINCIPFLRKIVKHLDNLLNKNELLGLAHFSFKDMISYSLQKPSKPYLILNGNEIRNQTA